MRTASRFWPYFFLLACLEGIAALFALASLPGEGLSLARGMGYLFILVPCLFAAGMFWVSWKKDGRFHPLDPIAHPDLFRALSVFASLLLLTSILILFLLRFLRPEATLPLYERARPILIYFSLLSAQYLLWTTILRRGLHLQRLRSQGALLRCLAGMMAGLLALWGLIALTGLGLTPDSSYWSEPGVPLLGWQLALTLLIGWTLTLFLWRRAPLPGLDIWFSLAVWLLAVTLWWSVPLETLRNSFYAPITPPLNRPLPASDAIYYDANAQSLLLGWGYIHSIPSRPMFMVFLAGLHALLGQDYAPLALAQTLIYALLPVTLYWLGRVLHGRLAGGMAALLAIFREWNSLWVASEVRVSNSRMLLSEFITTLALLAFLLVVIRWLRENPPQPRWALAAGGVLGLQLLLRTQVALLAPGILALTLLIFWPSWKRWALQGMVFTAGLVLAISPWLGRNISQTGQVVLDDPMQIRVVASMYSGGTPTSNLARFEGQSPQQIPRFIVETILQRPGEVAWFVANHFFANLIDVVLVLPIVARYDGLLAPIYPYWYEWHSYVSPLNILIWIIYLAVMTLGLAALWKRRRWVGLIPLVGAVAYIGATSLARYSGWRYVFPADWIGYFLLMVGAAEAMRLLASLFGADLPAISRPSEEEGSKPGFSAGRPAIMAGVVGLILLVGSLPWVMEVALPRASLPCQDADLVRCLTQSGLNAGQAEAFLSQPHALALQGRLLYPRYFSRNDGLASTNPSPAYAPRPFPRLGFLVLTPEALHQVVLPIKGVPSLPDNLAPVVILGCPRQGYVEARLVILVERQEIVVSDLLKEDCPPSDRP